MKHIFFFILIILASPALAGCSRAGIATNAPAASPSPGSTQDAAKPDPDVLIRPAQSGQVIRLSKGQIIRIVNPGLAAAWRVVYASEVLEALTPPDTMRAPGPEGWRFRAIAPGKTDLVLTSIAQPCPDPTPCPPVPARLVFTIEVK